MPIIEVTVEFPLAFDTSVFTHLRTEKPYVLKKRADYFAHTQRVPALPAMTIFESKWGIEKEYAKKQITTEQYEHYIQKIDDLTSVHQILSFDQKAAEIASYIYAHLSQKDKNKHWEDLFILATAVAHNHGLITQNVKDTTLLANLLPNSMDLRLAIWKP